MSFIVSFECGPQVAQVMAFGGLVAVLALAAFFGSRLFAKLEDDKRGGKTCEPETGDWSETHDHDDN